MGGKSDYLELKVINLVCGGVAFSAPATLYWALFVSDPADNGIGTEVIGGSYGRIGQTNNTTNFPVGNPKNNGTDVNFTTPSADWGLVSHWALFDASSGGNMLYFGPFVSPQTITVGIPVRIPAGSIQITED